VTETQVVVITKRQMSAPDVLPQFHPL